MFFDNGMTRVSQDTVISIVLNSLDIREALIHRFPISDVEIKPNAIFPAEQAKRKILIVAAPFRTPDLSNIHYNDYNFIEYKKGLIKRGVGLAADSHF